MKNKTILNLIIILGIILGGFYLISKTSNQSNDVNNTNEIATTTESTLSDTSDWETCRNEEYGYEFKYPNGWRMYETRFENNELVFKDTKKCMSNYVIIDNTDPKKNTPSPFFSIRILSKDELENSNYANITSVYEYQEIRDSYLQNPSSKISAEITIDNEKTLLFYGEPETSEGLSYKQLEEIRSLTPEMRIERFGLNAIFFHKRNIFTIETENLPLEILDIIFSTFKFID
ncbi:MAG: hypothetical protein PHX25_02200 [Candidatus Pacebacteria bacterium]|nr:hypothetical protein [Candidatus Paceibacterota bacterium]